LFGAEYVESQWWGSPPSTTRSLPFGYPSTTLRASAQGPRSRSAGQVWAA